MAPRPNTRRRPGSRRRPAHGPPSRDRPPGWPAAITSASGQAERSWPPATSHPRTSAQVRPSASAAAMPRSRSPAGFRRTTRRSASTWRIRSVVPLTTAVSSCRSRSSASRRRAPWNATASSWRASWMTRIPSGSGSRASSAQRLSRMTGGSSETTTGRPPRSPAAQTRPSSRSPRVAGSGDGASLPDRGEQVQPAVRRLAQPERSAIDGGEADRLERDGPREVGERPARRDQLAQLVLGEERVRLALGVVEGSPTLALERLDPWPGGPLGRSSASQRAQEQQARDGPRIAVADRPLTEAHRETTTGDQVARRRASRRDPRRTAATYASSSVPPASRAAPKATAAGASVSRIVLSPG